MPGARFCLHSDAVGPAPLSAVVECRDRDRPSENKSTSAYRILGAVAFFLLALELGGTTARILWQRYGGPFFGSFGFNFNFGLFRFGEPWSSWSVLLCCALFSWAGCSLARRSGSLRVGAIVGATAFLVLLAGCLAEL